jgi:hypothetical protein
MCIKAILNKAIEEMLKQITSLFVFHLKLFGSSIRFL